MTQLTDDLLRESRGREWRTKRRRGDREGGGGAGDMNGGGGKFRVEGGWREEREGGDVNVFKENLERGRAGRKAGNEEGAA